MSRRGRSALRGELIRWSVIPIVVLATLYGVISYSFEAPARQVVDWPAIDTYFRRDFSGAGFAIVCNFGDPRPHCTMRWKPPFDPNAAPIEVYRCDDESDETREAVLMRFASRVRSTLDDDTRGRTLAVLNAFFESGLRQNIDRALRRARENANFANRLPPFELENRAGTLNWVVAGVDDTLQAIPTGLPNRPPYLGSVYASWDGSRGNLVQVTARSAQAESSVWLTPGHATPCNQLFPGSPESGNCGSVDILLCDPRVPGCIAESALNVRALGPGSVLVMRAGGNAGQLLARTLDPLNVEDYVALQQSTGGRSTTLYVDGIERLPDLSVEVSHETSPPLSRLRLVNGRWTRWFERSVEPWLVPVVNRMNRYASDGEKRIDPEKSMTLTVDLELQSKLDDALDLWMSTHAELPLRAHMQAHFRGRRLSLRRGESGHRRAAPEAGLTVIDAETGHVLAVASYPPASALVDDEGVPTFAPGWQARLAGPGAPPWAQREIVSALADRLQEDANSNFVRHPIGSTIKPLMLGAVIDDRAGDGLSRLFDLVVAGHTDSRGRANGGSDERPVCDNCGDPAVEAISGLPLGPWGAEEAQGGHAGDQWVDRTEFLLASCNKYAVTLGVLTMLDWSSGAARTRPTACCWVEGRDQFGFAGNPGGAAPAQLFATESSLPPLGRWLDPDTYETRGEFANAPIFKRLEHYYGLHAGSGRQSYDSEPWIACAGIPGLATTVKESEFFGRVETTELALTSNRVSTAFTNIFTGGGRNWWTNVKLAEAYARVATNRRVQATFCAPPRSTPAPAQQFSDGGRWRELVDILARQRETAGWVRPRAPNITRWVNAAPGRVTFSKTGTSLREAGFSSTGVFAMYIGAMPANTGTGDPIPNGRGFVVIAHIDDIGHSGDAVQLLDDVFPILARRLQ